MNRWIIVRIPDGAFVARAGSPSSYTRRLQHARTFATREQAEADRCPENERVRQIDDVIEAADRMLPL